MALVWGAAFVTWNCGGGGAAARVNSSPVYAHAGGSSHGATAVDSTRANGGAAGGSGGYSNIAAAAVNYERLQTALSLSQVDRQQAILAAVADIHGWHRPRSVAAAVARRRRGVRREGGGRDLAGSRKSAVLHQPLCCW